MVAIEDLTPVLSGYGLLGFGVEDPLAFLEEIIAAFVKAHHSLDGPQEGRGVIFQVQFSDHAVPSFCR